MTKIVFLDVDGTLVSYENDLPKSAIEAIKQTQAKGNYVVTVTGRSKAEMYENILNIGFDGYIGGNGSYIEFNEEVIKAKTLPLEDTKKIVAWLINRGLEFYLEGNSGLYASKNFANRGKSTIKEYSQRKDPTANISIKEAFPEMIFNGQLDRSDINKISFILDSYEDFTAAQEAFPTFKLGTWGGVGEKALFGDIALGGIDKGGAVTELLSHLQLSKEESYAFGDAKVDIPMLKTCGVGIAMGNGGPEIKQMADYVTASVDENGLWHAFKHFNLL